MDWTQILKQRLANLKRHPTPEELEEVASVLVLIGQNEKTQEELLVLTKRTDAVETHKGHVSFPGGYFEAQDADLYTTAVRETFEEIGVRKEDIDYLGVLEFTHTLDGIPIFPYVAKIRLPYTFQVNRSEVERLLFLPLERLILEGLTPVEIVVDTRSIRSEGIRIGEDLVWGATARILRALRSHLHP